MNNIVKLVLILGATFSTSLLAMERDCYEFLTGGLQDSFMHKVFIGDIQHNEDETLDKETAEAAVAAVLKKHGACEYEETRLEPARCAQALQEKICKIQGGSGYFIILKDYVDTVNVIFNRWD